MLAADKTAAATVKLRNVLAVLKCIFDILPFSFERRDSVHENAAFVQNLRPHDLIRAIRLLQEESLDPEQSVVWRQFLPR
jgi:hypothetical protein